MPFPGMTTSPFSLYLEPSLSPRDIVHVYTRNFRKVQNSYKWYAENVDALRPAVCSLLLRPATTRYQQYHTGELSSQVLMVYVMRIVDLTPLHSLPVQLEA